MVKAFFNWWRPEYNIVLGVAIILFSISRFLFAEPTVLTYSNIIIGGINIGIGFYNMQLQKDRRPGQKFDDFLEEKYGYNSKEAPDDDEVEIEKKWW